MHRLHHSMSALAALFLVMIVLNPCVTGAVSKDMKISEINSDSKKFFGTWQTYSFYGDLVQITIREDNTAETSLFPGKVHRWKMKDGSIHIQWMNGWSDVISLRGDKLFMATYPPDDVTVERRTKTSLLRRVQK